MDTNKNRKKYIVLGHTTVTVAVEVTANDEEEAMGIARKKFGGVTAYAGNGGRDKLIGVDGENESIYSDERVKFDDVMEDA